MIITPHAYISPDSRLLSRWSELVKIWNSLNTKLVVSFVVLVLAITGMTFLVTYGDTKTALMDSTQDNLKELSKAMAHQVDVASFSDLKAGDDDTVEYRALIEHLRGMRADSDVVVNCYIIRVNGTQLEFIADDAEEGPAEIGYVYEAPTDHDLIVAAMTDATTSAETYSDEWGTFLSGYAPIKDANGTAVAVLGVDMDASAVVERLDFVGDSIYLVMIAGILIAAVVVAVLALSIVRDIKKLNATANKISMGEMDVSVDVKRKDEVGELADSFSRMVASLKFEMLSRQEDERSKGQ